MSQKKTHTTVSLDVASQRVLKNLTKALDRLAMAQMKNLAQAPKSPGQSRLTEPELDGVREDGTL